MPWRAGDALLFFFYARQRLAFGGNAGDGYVFEQREVFLFHCFVWVVFLGILGIIEVLDILVV